MITIGNNNKIKNSNIGSDNKYKKILTELEEWLKEEQNKLSEKQTETLTELHRIVRLETIKNTLDKIQELKEKYK